MSKIKQLLKFSRVGVCSLALLFSSIITPLLANNALAKTYKVTYHSGTKDGKDGDKIVDKNLSTYESALRGLYTYKYGDGGESIMNGATDDSEAGNKGIKSVRSLVEEGYKFIGWKVMQGATEKGIYAEGKAFSEIEQNKDLRAVAQWAKISIGEDILKNDDPIDIKVDSVKLGTVEMTQEKGTPSSSYNTIKRAKNETTNKYDLVYDNSNITIKITPITGYQVKSFKIDGTETKSALTEDNTYVFTTLDADKTIAVEFEKIPCDITVTHDENVTVDPAESPILVHYGDDQELTILPNEGYKIDDITRDGTSIKELLGEDGVINIENVTDDTTIVITVERIKQTISINAADNAVIDPTGDVKVYYGDNQEISILPLPGYYIQSILVNGEEMITSLMDYSLTLENIKTDMTVEVITAAEDYKVIEGGNQTLSIADKDDLTVRFNGSCALFTEASINGVVLNEDNYEVTCGSTILTVNHDYLATLSEGTHTIRASYANGNYGEATFELKRESLKAPETGESQQNSAAANSVTPLSIILITAVTTSIASLLFILVRRKKQNS